MTTMNISLPDEMKDFIETRVTEEGYPTASDYVLALIREAQKRRAKEVLEAKLVEGLQGSSVEMTPADWDSIRRDAVAGLADESLRP